MKRVKLSLNYNTLDSNELSVFGNHVLTNMTGNAGFPSSAPILNFLSSSLTALDAAIRAPHPDSLSIKARVLAVQKSLYAVKGMVELECNDDEEVAASSGFDLKTSSSRRPKTFSVRQGSANGTADLTCPHVKGSGYIWEMISDPINENEWSVYRYTVVTELHVTGLTPGNKYWFRVKTVTSKGEESYSDPYMLHVI
jgi:hypothetical protein